jgi:hypothetical protein
MRQKLLCALFSLVIGGIVIRTGSIAEATKEPWRSSRLETLQEDLRGDDSYWVHETPRVGAAPALLEFMCSTEQDGTVPILTFFFNDVESSREPGPQMCMFPCATPLNAEE